MINLTISGNSFEEINKQLLDVVRGIGGGPAVSVDTVVQPETHEVTLTPAPQPAAVETPKRKRRTPEEMEADKAAKLAAAQAEVKAAQPVQAPITIPSIPTTHHAVSLPKETVEPVQQSFTPPAPVQQPANAYNLQMFKQNLIMIVNELLSSGKLTSEWIKVTSQTVFAGADLWMWAQNEAKIKELYDSFVEWQFIQKFEA